MFASAIGSPVPAELATAWLGVLLEVTVKGSVVVLGAIAVAAALRQASAAVRHLVWSVAVAALLVLPVLPAGLPEWEWRVAPPAPLAALWDGPAIEPGTARSTDAGGATAATPIAGAVTLMAEGAPARAAAGERTAAAGVPSGESSESPLTLPERRTAPGAASGPESAEAPLRWRSAGAAAAFAVWLAGLASLLASRLAGTLRVRRLARRAQPLGAGRAATQAARIGAGFGLRRPVRLLEGDATAMPMTWGFLRPVVLLPAGSEAWPESRLHAVLLHELAHVRRCDHLTQLAAALTCALYWYNPLVWLAARRMRIEREHACDDHVLNAGAAASDYAGDLLDVARALRAGRATSRAAMAMARPSQLEGRLLAVLDPHRSRTAVSGRMAAPAGLAAAALVLPLAAMSPTWAQRLDPATDAGVVEVVNGVAGAETGRQAPGFAEPAAVDPGAPCWEEQGSSSSSNHSASDDVHVIEWSNGRSCSMEIRIEGEVEFTDEMTGIAGLSPGGLLRIEERDGRTERRLEVRPERDGSLVYEWSVDGERRAFDAGARAWLSDVLLQLFRRTGFAAEQRVDSLLEKGGGAAVLAEVPLISSDHAQRRYLQLVLERTGTDAALVARVLPLAGRELGSDFELAELLITVADRHTFTDDTRQAFIEAAGSIGSDYEHRRVLTAALQGGRLSARNVNAILISAGGIDSDFELAELLISLSGEYRFDAAMRKAYLAATRTIESDFEQRRVFSTLLGQGGLSPENLTVVLDAAEGIESDFELAELLTQLSGFDLSDPALQRAYLDAARSIDSDYEHRRVLSTLIGGQRVGPEALALALRSAQSIDSDFQLAELLVEIAEKHTLAGDLRAAYLGAAETIGSDHEHGRVASALLRQERVSGTL